MSLENTYKQNVFVTGATGFVGRPLCEKLLLKDCSVCGSVRIAATQANLPAGVQTAAIETIGPDTDWSAALTGIDVVVHLAARVHVMDEGAADPLAEFRRVNVAGTERLARQAAAAGVRRLVFLSSVKVNGEGRGVSYTETDPPAPEDPYGISKLEAENVLRKIAAETGLEVVIIRPPLVYGPGVKANFLNMMKIICKRNFGFWIFNFGLKDGIPLPFALINNRRSLIYVGNLVDAVAVCATHPRAAGQTFLVSDGEDVSTPELVRRVAHAFGVPPRLVSLPVSVMKFIAKLLDNFGFWIIKSNFKFWILNFGFSKSKKEDVIQNLASKIQNCRFTGAVNRLTGSLTVDTTKIRRDLGWVPPFTMEEGLLETAAWFRGKL